MRALLNLGHTFGHALEAECGYGDSLLHGEAVAMGMALAFGSRRRYEGAQRLSKLGRGPLANAAVPGWTAMRDLPQPPEHTFRDWWQNR